jgi:hypothetical protein
MEPTSGKTGPKIAAAIAKILRRCKYKPTRIQCDFGREFYNGAVEKLLSERGIRLYSTRTGMKCTLAERFIRTIFGKIARYQTHHKTNRFVDKLRHFENMYNNSYHRSIGMAPNQVEPDNVDRVHISLYRSRIPPLYKEPEFRVGEAVLAVKPKKTFEKGYTANYDPKPYQIIQILTAPPRMYLCKRGSAIDSFYETELVRYEVSAPFL